MRLLFTICARAGSKGVVSKNIREFLGNPLVYYTLSAYADFVRSYSDIYEKVDLAINTDSEILLEQCRRTKVAFTHIPREAELGGDRVAKADVICDTLMKMERRNNVKYDVTVDLDVTSPLRTTDDITGCLRTLLESADANVCYTVVSSRRQPHFNLVLKTPEGYLEKAIKSHYTARQEAPESYDMNASIYAYRRDPLLKTAESNVFEGRCVGWQMKDTAVLDIDSEEDFELMSVLGEYFYNKYEEYRAIRDGIGDLFK